MTLGIGELVWTLPLTRLGPRTTYDPSPTSLTETGLSSSYVLSNSLDTSHQSLKPEHQPHLPQG